MNLDIRKAYLLLGSNLGDRQLYLERAKALIASEVGEVVAQSSIYETAAWGKTDQPGFLNMALAVETKLDPLELLDKVLGIELALGRVRHEKWGSRLIDIDIIFYGEEVVAIGDELQIPHPEMQNRRFVLQPLAEIAPDFIHPVLHQNLTEILASLSDSLSVKIIS